MATPSLKFGHIGIYVYDLPLMETFYKNMLGYTVTDRGEVKWLDGTTKDLVFLSQNPKNHHEVILSSGRPQAVSFNPINQISLRTETVGSLRSIWQKIRDAKVEDIQTLSHGSSISVYMKDPEGNRLELYWETPWYVPQPSRIEVNLDLTDDELLSYVEQQARLREGFVPRSEWQAKMALLMASR